ncbi:TetR family transcriptional regulator [Plantibacter sp. YIM 135249]|uniref:TetR family transcriptional regulator n=1 Tax=Plantibacter sp. YIM 135249 TaxID=3423918 RepID=UPI003D328C26
MVVRNPEDKKRSLLEAALIEFAAKGLVGTRTEDIASRAGCSAGLVYTYFGSKEGLFDAVLDDITARTVEFMPITPEDLPGYAARLYEAGAHSADVDRFAGWYELQRGPDNASRLAVEEATRKKIQAVAAALDEGTIESPLAAPELVLTVQTIARMWALQPREIVNAVGGDLDSRSKAVRTAVESLVTKN